MTTFEVVHAIENGNRIVIVPLSNSTRKIKLLDKDYKELVKLGVGLPWKWAVGQVWVRNGGRNNAVARLLLDADKGEVIRYVDKNPANLLLSNLARVAGNGKYRARDRIVSTFKWNQPEIIHRQAITREGLDVFMPSI